MQVEILHNQSLLDIANQHAGLIDGMMEIAVLNAISVSDTLTPGQLLQLPEDLVNDTDILQYFNVKNVRPATEITATDADLISYNQGIGYSQIGQNFEVQ